MNTRNFVVIQKFVNIRNRSRFDLDGRICEGFSLGCISTFLHISLMGRDGSVLHMGKVFRFPLAIKFWSLSLEDIF